MANGKWQTTRDEATRRFYQEKGGVRGSNSHFEGWSAVQFRNPKAEPLSCAQERGKSEGRNRGVRRGPSSKLAYSGLGIRTSFGFRASDFREELPK